ncbi:MAG: hypothetical protein HWE39_07800 [Oceanospirillaceae bacterium]|nr:hypothetical protein [Oceanospirillaceae bacterium]
MTDLHEWLRRAYAAEKASLDPLIQQFNRGLGMKIGLNQALAELSTRAPFQALMQALVDQVIRPSSGQLRFSTTGHLGVLDGRTLRDAQALDSPCATYVALHRIREHLEVSIAYLLRDIHVGKHALFGLDWHPYGFSLPRTPSERTEQPIKLMADLKTHMIYCPAHYFAGSSTTFGGDDARHPGARQRDCW